MKNTKYVKPATVNASMGVCAITPFKSRIASICPTTIMMGV